MGHMCHGHLDAAGFLGPLLPDTAALPACYLPIFALRQNPQIVKNEPLAEKVSLRARGTSQAAGFCNSGTFYASVSGYITRYMGYIQNLLSPEEASNPRGEEFASPPTGRLLGSELPRKLMPYGMKSLARKPLSPRGGCSCSWDSLYL